MRELTQIEKDFIDTNIKKMSYAEIANSLSLNVRQLEDWCYYNGYSRKRTLQHSKKSKHYDAIMSRINTKSLPEIAEELGLSANHVYKIVQKCGIDVKGLKSKTAKITKEDLIQCIGKYSIKDIGKIFGISSWSVTRLLKIHGLNSTYQCDLSNLHKAAKERIANPTIKQGKQWIAFQSKTLSVSDIPDELAELEILKYKTNKLLKQQSL